MNIKKLEDQVNQFKPKYLSTIKVSSHQRNIYSRPNIATRDTKKLLSIYYSLKKLAERDANKKIIKMILTKALEDLNK